MKIVMVVNNTLPAGLAANTAAVLGISLGKALPGIVGEDCPDASGHLHKGITSRVIPVLTADAEALNILKGKVIADSSLSMIGFSRTAQESLTYEEYMEKLSLKVSEELEYSGICLYGSRKKVDSLTGAMPLLK